MNKPATTPGGVGIALVRAILAAGALAVLTSSCGTGTGAGTVGSEVSEPPLVPTGPGFVALRSDEDPRCAPAGDIYELSEPGTYAAFAVGSPDIVTEVLDPHGEVLATSEWQHAHAGRVDVLTGIRYDVAPPSVFDVDSSVLLHIRTDELPYELVLVRLGGGHEWSDIDVQPPVAREDGASASCLVGDSSLLHIDVAAVMSELDGRQTFRIVASGDQRP